MSRQSPLLALHQHAHAIFADYGEAATASTPPAPSPTAPATASPEPAGAATAGAPASPILVVQTYAQLELEYASIRKAAALLDMPYRGTLIVRGADRLAFLNRMLTQELKNARPGDARRAFWLNRKGRIDADLRVIVREDDIVLDVDVHASERTRATLSAYVITEDVQIEDQTEQWHRLSLHGPSALISLSRIATVPNQPAGTPLALMPDHAITVQIAGVDVLVDRLDSTGEIGLELLAPASGVLSVYHALLTLAHEPASAQRMNAPPLVRPIGFAAWNIARLEAGTPVYYLDFGPDSLPGESGVLSDRVSFTKGCYLGQEIVARMNALGHPKQRVVALRLTDPSTEIDASSASLSREAGSEAREILMARFPNTGAPLYLDTGAPADANTPPAPVGAITSSTLAPLLSRSPIALAMVAWKASQPGTKLLVDCDGALLPGVVQEHLTFVKRPEHGA